jgi:hypothetical protein
MKIAKASKHISPMQYRVVWTGEHSVEESVQHYSVYHSSEALDFLAHTLRKGHIHSKVVKVKAVEEWCRFTQTWTNRTEVAFLHASAPEIGEGNIISNG